ncbi:MAG: amidohydrolase family protein, partial [Deltaproteobacteria bacterium]|nr:amidohydrolase family protein [Deltaproteobacteria bacterium]
MKCQQKSCTGCIVHLTRIFTIRRNFLGLYMQSGAQRKRAGASKSWRIALAFLAIQSGLSGRAGVTSRNWIGAAVTFLRMSFLAALGFLLGCGGAEIDFARSLAVPQPADLILRNGKIVTVDRNFSIKRAVAIKDGRFLAAGSERDMRLLTGPRTKVVDLAGHTVIPGLIDGQIHATKAGIRWEAARLKIANPSLDLARQGLRNCFVELNRLGITSVIDLHGAEITFAHRRILAEMARSGELALRVNYYVKSDSA